MLFKISGNPKGIFKTKYMIYLSPERLTLPRFPTFLFLTNSHPPARSPLPTRKGKGSHVLPPRHIKPDKCVTGQYNAHRGKSYLPFSPHTSSQMPLIGCCLCDWHGREGMPFLFYPLATFAMLDSQLLTAPVFEFSF